jgi:hypothetical protein
MACTLHRLARNAPLARRAVRLPLSPRFARLAPGHGRDQRMGFGSGVRSGVRGRDRSGGRQITPSRPCLRRAPQGRLRAPRSRLDRDHARRVQSCDARDARGGRGEDRRGTEESTGGLAGCAPVATDQETEATKEFVQSLSSLRSPTRRSTQSSVIIGVRIDDEAVPDSRPPSGRPRSPG